VRCRAWLVIALAACLQVACGPRSQRGPSHPGGQPSYGRAPRTVPRLAAPPVIDASARGAAYLSAVALSLQPAWHQFLEDCRLRLPADHALNDLALVAMVEIEVGKQGTVLDVQIGGSGNADFDHAASQIVRDASPLPPPPRELWSDDDRVHLVWTFARDRRQAGPASAQVIERELPLRGVVLRLLGERDFARAARRIRRARPGPDRDAVTQQLMTEVLRDALAVSDQAVRRAAVEAVGRARVIALAMDVAALSTSTLDDELAIVAIETLSALGVAPGEAIDIHSVVERPRVSLAKLRAVVTHGRMREAQQELAAMFASISSPMPGPNAKTLPTLLLALAIAPVEELATSLPAWFRSRDARQRAAVCTALAGYAGDVAWPLLARGLADRDATVRASCLASVYSAREPPTRRAAIASQRSASARIRDLARDRDSTVRAAAIVALAHVDPAHLPDASNDVADDVRVAYAAALAHVRDQLSGPGDATAKLHALAKDRDPSVRAAAWTALVATPASAERTQLAARAAGDAAAEVRRAAIRAIADDAVLVALASRDADAGVRTAALVELAGRRGRAATTDLLLERIADAAAGSGERVRSALAWLLAR
jgi:TonB family protein